MECDTISAFDKFVQDNEAFVKSFKPRYVHSECKYYMVIVEPRKHSNFEFVCKTMFNFTDSNWGLQVFHSIDNDQYVKECLKDVENVRYVNLNVNTMTITDYNKLLTNKEFYNMIPSDTFIIFQTDSCLLKEGIDGYTMFDYIGAPWPHRNFFAGNGGFSIRKKRFILRCLDTFERPPKTNEDVFFSTCSYFSVNGRRLNRNFPSLAKAMSFSCEYIVTKELPLGVHKVIENIHIDNLNDVFRANFAKSNSK